MRIPPLAALRAAMGVGTTVVLFVLLYARLVPEAVSLEPGAVADRTIVAPRSVSYVDTEATAARQQEAAGRVADQYKPVADAAELVARTINDIFDAAVMARQQVAAEVQADAEAEAEIDPAVVAGRIRERVEIALSEETVTRLASTAPSALDRLRRDALLLAAEQMQGMLRDNTDDLQKAVTAIGQKAAELPLTPPYQQMLADIAGKALRPNLRYDEQKTAEARRAAAMATAAVMRQLEAGEIVIAAGETVAQRHIDALKALGLMAPTLDYSRAVSLFVMLGVLVLALGGWIARSARDVWLDDRQMLLLCAALVVAAAGFRASVQLHIYGPVTLGISTALAMIIAMLLGTRLAVVFGVALGLLTGIVSTSSDARLVIATTLCSAFAAHAIASAGGKSLTIVRAAGLVGAANALVFVVTSEVFGLSLSINQVVASLLAGLISASVAVIAVMALERVVGVVTNLRLLELANPNEPILHRLLTEAPGSYQSSVMVANLAEPAAEQIGADALLVRTAAMYHDIGKLKRPYFFVENQFGADNPHEKLKPHLSALTLMAHVKDGVELARQAGLPDAIIDLLRQHHGTSLASYPYHLAVQQEGEANVNEADFRYPGPKPQTREAGLLMLADAVEAAARTLVNPTYDQIEELVERVVRGKMEDGQLDECPLTFADLRSIRESFVNTLRGMFHQRLRYPDQEEQEREAPAAVAH
ncbi:MAG: HD family phosphohydrolase [Armatimonadota bacterium]